MIAAGRRYLDEGDPAKARFAFLIGESVYSHSAPMLAWLATALEKLGRTEEALETYRRAVDRDASLAVAQAGIERLAGSD